MSATVARTLTRADNAARSGAVLEAMRLYEAVLTRFPRNTRALASRKKLLGASNAADLLTASGVDHMKAERFEAAADRFAQAIANDPSHLRARTQGAIALAAIGRHAEARAWAEAGVALAPDQAAPHATLSRVHAMAGQLGFSASAGAAALRRNPETKDAWRTVLEAAAQTPQILAALDAWPPAAPGPRHPLLYSLELLCRYLGGDLARCEAMLVDRDQTVTADALSRLDRVNAAFSRAYAVFISRLIQATPQLQDEAPADPDAAPLFHLGESHCLSFAHRTVRLDGRRRRVTPRLVIGAKAFHLGQSSADRHQAVFRAHAAMLPKGARALLSFGEIDCRADEGILFHCRKSGRPIADVAAETAEGYVAFADATLSVSRARLWFLTVPAPVIEQKDTAAAADRIELVQRFNAALTKAATARGYGVIDTHAASAGPDGAAHGRLHCDRIHLGPEALAVVQKALDADGG